MHIVLLKCHIAFLKYTSCDNQALVGCIPIAAVAVHLNLKSKKKIGRSSYKKYSNNILNFQESKTISNAHTKKSGNLFNDPRVCVCMCVCVCVCCDARRAETRPLFN